MLRCVLAFFCAWAFSVQASIPPEKRTATEILQKVQEADDVCADGSLIVPTVVDPSAQEGMKIVERPVLLCAYGYKTGTWHRIEVRLPYPTPREYIACIQSAPTLLARRYECSLPVSVVTPGYRVSHQAGFGVTRFVVHAYGPREDAGSSPTFGRWGESLVVFRTRHLWFDDDALASGSVSRVIETVRAVNYTPYDDPEFENDDLARRGAHYLLEQIRAARAELAIPSRAFPGKTVASVVPWEIPFALAAIEQMDDKSFDENMTRATESVLVEYALNEGRAFKWSQSNKYAIGALQFTNAGGNGTYALVVRLYPQADLDPNFDTGARDLRNVLKAAMCLIDLEIAQLPEIKPLYLKDPKLGGIYPVAAYNGGHRSARVLYEWLRRKKITTQNVSTALPDTLVMGEKRQAALVSGKKGKKKVRYVVTKTRNTETPGYIEKYLFLLNYLSEKELD